MKNTDLFEYEKRKALIENSYYLRLRNINKRIAAVLSCFFLSQIIILIGLFSSKSFYYFFAAVTFCVEMIFFLDLFKKKKDLKTRYQYELRRMTYELEKQEIYVDEEYEKDNEKYNNAELKKKKQVIMIICVIAILIVMMFVFLHWLFTFNPKEWKTMPWKRKFMWEDLMKQQDWDDQINNRHKYNFKFMTKEEILDMLTVPDGSEYTPNIIFEGNYDFEKYCTLLFAYYDKKNKRCMWLLLEQGSGVWSNCWTVNLVEDGYYYSNYISDNNNVE